MIDEADLAGLPAPDDGRAGAAPPRRPRNYLATAERRLLLWRFMPLALAVLLVLTVVERTWFPPRESRPTPPVDTRLEAVNGPLPDGDEVVIESAPEPWPSVADEEQLGAPAATLSKVRDDTFFRDADTDAWLQTFRGICEAGQEAILRKPAQRVSFSELFGQPRSFRGRLVRLRGTLHRMERLAAPKNHYGIEHYWQGWLEPAGGPVSPIVVHCLQVPAGMATGLKIDEPVEVTGYFLKRYAYAAADDVRVAPLVLALEPVRRPPPAAVTGASSLGTVALVSMAALIAAVLLGSRLAGRAGGRRAHDAPVDLTAAFSGHEPFSAAESLRRLGAQAAAAPRGKGEKP